MKQLFTTCFLFVSSLGLAGYYFDNGFKWMTAGLFIVALISLKIMTNEIKEI